MGLRLRRLHAENSSWQDTNQYTTSIHDRCIIACRLLTELHVKWGSPNVLYSFRLYFPNQTDMSHRPHTPDLPPYRLSRRSSIARSRAIQPRAGDARWGMGDVAGSEANPYRTPLYWHGSALRNNEYNIVSYMYVTEEGTNPLRALPLRACPSSPLVITRYGGRKGVGARSQLPLSTHSFGCTRLHDYTTCQAPA